MPGDPNRLMSVPALCANDVTAVLVGMGVSVFDCRAQQVPAHQLAPLLLDRLARASGGAIQTFHDAASVEDTGRLLLEAAAALAMAEVAPDRVVGLVARALKQLIERLAYIRSADSVTLAALALLLDAHTDAALSRVAAHG